jgi:membrane protein DedA with SNARE-associated domain
VAAGILMYHKHLTALSSFFNVIVMILCSLIGSQIAFLVSKKYSELIEKSFKTKQSRYNTLLYKANKKTVGYLDRYNMTYISLIYKFIPLVRTLVPFLIGIGKNMRFMRFLLLNAISSTLWILFFYSIGYYTSRTIGSVKYSGLITAIVIVCTLFPVFYEFIKNKRRNNNKTV